MTSRRSSQHLTARAVNANICHACLPLGRLRGSVTLEHGGPGGRIHAESWKAAGAPSTAERGTDTEHKCAVCGSVVDAMYFDDDATGGRVKVSCWQQRRRQSSTAAASSSKTAAESARDVAASTTASGSLASFLDVQASFDAEAALPPLRLTRGALGWVYKQGRKAKTWKRRWAVIRAACLVYYTDASCATLKGSVPLAGARVAAVLVTDAPRALGPREGFEVVHAPSGRTLVAFPQLAEQHASGDPAAVRDACRLWVAALEASIAEATGATGAEEAAAAAEQRVLARQSSIEIGGEAAEEDEASEDDGDGLSLDGVSLAVDDGAPPPPPPPVARGGRHRRPPPSRRRRSGRRRRHRRRSGRRAWPPPSPTHASPPPRRTRPRSPRSSPRPATRATPAAAARRGARPRGPREGGVERGVQHLNLRRSSCDFCLIAPGAGERRDLPNALTGVRHPNPGLGIQTQG